MKVSKHQKEQVVEVEFDYRVEDVFLRQLTYATSVKNPAGFTYEITFDTSSDMRPAVFDFAHDNGLKTIRLEQKN